LDRESKYSSIAGGPASARFDLAEITNLTVPHPRVFARVGTTLPTPAGFERTVKRSHYMQNKTDRLEGSPIG
jgi:hypothetical protein